MGRQSTSQWDFGELFPREQPVAASAAPAAPAAPARTIFSVSELTARIRHVLEAQVGSLKHAREHEDEEAAAR